MTPTFNLNFKFLPKDFFSSSSLTLQHSACSSSFIYSPRKCSTEKQCYLVYLEQTWNSQRTDSILPLQFQAFFSWMIRERNWHSYITRWCRLGSANFRPQYKSGPPLVLINKVLLTHSPPWLTYCLWVPLWPGSNSAQLPQSLMALWQHLALYRKGLLIAGLDYKWHLKDNTCI